MNFGTTTKLLQQLDHFYFKLQCHYDEEEHTIKKDKQTPSKWQDSTKENPKTVSYANAIAIILGQEFENNKYLVGIDIDDKKDAIVKDIKRDIKMELNILMSFVSKINTILMKLYQRKPDPADIVYITMLMKIHY